MKSQVGKTCRFRSWLLKDGSAISCILFRDDDSEVQWEIWDDPNNITKFNVQVVSTGFAEDMEYNPEIREWLRKVFKTQVVKRIIVDT